jgi:hypothetical protein
MQGGEGLAEIFELSVVEGGHPHFSGCCDVGGGVVDEQAAMDWSADPFGGDEIDARVGFRDTDAGGTKASKPPSLEAFAVSPDSQPMTLRTSPRNVKSVHLKRLTPRPTIWLNSGVPIALRTRGRTCSRWPAIAGMRRDSHVHGNRECLTEVMYQCTSSSTGAS